MSLSPSHSRSVNSLSAAPASATRLMSWIPAMIFAYTILISPLLSTAAGSGDDKINVEVAQSNALNQLFWLGVLGLTLISLRHSFPLLRRLFTLPIVWFIGFYLAVAVASVLWSPVPGIAFRRVGLQIVVVSSLLIAMVTSDSKRAILDNVFIVICATITINFLAVATQQPGPLGYEGIYAQKNGLGGVAAISLIFCLYFILLYSGWRRVAALGVAGMAIIELVVSQSKTSLGLALLLPSVAGVIVFFGGKFRVSSPVLVLFGVATLIIGWLFGAYLFRYSFADLSMLLFKDVTFTGRTVIWEFVLEIISRRPMLGQGYASFWGAGADSIVIREAPGFLVELLQAHNGYLDVMVETGVVGFSILLCIILCGFWSAERAIRIDGRLAWLAWSLLLFAICHNFLESSWFRGFSFNWLIFLFAAMLSSGPRRGSSQGTSNM